MIRDTGHVIQDEMAELQEVGVNVVFNLYSEAGAGYAEHIYQKFGDLKE